jgi:hypothetical protein
VSTTSERRTWPAASPTRGRRDACW